MRSAFALVFFLCAAPAYAATPASSAPPTTQQAAVAVTGWRLECDPVKTTLACHALDNIVQAQNGALIVGLAISSNADGKAVLTTTVPLGTSVHAAVSVTVAGGPTQQFPFLTCSQQGCFATGTINADLLTAMRAAKGNMSVTYGVLDANLAEHTVTASVSLAGFPAVYDRLK